MFRVWNNGDSLTASDLNSSFTTVGVTNFVPLCLDAYSTDLTQMRATTDPFPSSTESQATTMGGELERLRYVIENALGWSHWYAHNANAATTQRSAFSQTFTWNNGGTTFQAAWLLNVTDTASASGSLLLDLQVGGTSKFKVGKDGSVTATSVPVLGTVTSGLWHGTIIGAAFGGTGFDASAAANGVLPIGNGTGFTGTTLTAGTGIGIVNGAGSVTISNTSNLGASVFIGLGLSNDGGSPGTILDIDAGACNSDDGTIANRVSMTLLNAMTGAIGGTWVVGTGQPKLDTGTVAATTWYHVWVIQRVDTGVTDWLFSLSASSPTMPTNYTKKRRVGSFKTDGSSHIIAFVQYGDEVWWATPILETTSANPGTSAVTQTLAAIPTGLKVKALLRSTVTNSTSNSAQVYISSLDTVDLAPSATLAPLANSSGTNSTANPNFGEVEVWTNTSAQVRTRMQTSGAADQLRLVTRGWFDRRGRDQ